MSSKQVFPVAKQFTFQGIRSTSLEESSVNVRLLYRTLRRSIPGLCRMLDAEVPHYKVIRALQHSFRRHAGVRDPRLVDLLVFEGKLAYDEYVRQFKSRLHLFEWLDNMEREFEAAPSRQTQGKVSVPTSDFEELLMEKLEKARTSREQTQLNHALASNEFLDRFYVGDKQA
eukprot:Rmarinus@m.9627